MNFSNVQKIVYLLFVLSSLFLGNWARAESRLALVIGNGAYPEKKQGVNDVAALSNPKNDAEDMAELLQNSGFTLVDDAGRNLPLIDGTKQQMDAAVDKFLEKLNRTPDAVAWFYYSGHGVYLKDVKRPSESANYLLPVGHNFRADDPAGIKYYAVNAHELKDRLQNTPVKNRLMIFDACRQKLELSESKGFGAGDEFRPMDPEHGLMVVHATLHSYLSFGNPNERNSNFTKYLLAALKQQTSKYITQAISLGITQVTAANKSLNEKYHQHPRVEGLLSEDFCLAGCGGVVKEKPVLPPVALPPAQVVPTPISEPTPPAPKITQTPQRKSFKDCDVCPEMVLIPAGTFEMGSNRGSDNEKPVHSVSVNSFYMSKYETTFDEYKAFANATARKKPNDDRWGQGKRPIINVSWKDAVAYAEWLSLRTGRTYRLPTEAEWEYAARGGTTTEYWWDDGYVGKNANCDGCATQWDNKKTAPVGSFSSNAFGLYDTSGNVWEWTCSEYDDYSTGKHTKCNQSTDSQYVIRGGSWYIQYQHIRSATRGEYGISTNHQANDLGFRLIVPLAGRGL